MKCLQIVCVFLLSVTLESRVGFAETVQNERLNAPVAQVSAGSQMQKPAKMVLVKEGDLFQVYRPETEAEAKAAALAELKRQSEAEAAKAREEAKAQQAALRSQEIARVAALEKAYQQAREVLKTAERLEMKREELRKAAQTEAERQAEIEEEKLRLVALLTGAANAE